MCHLITLVVPAAESEAVLSVMKRHSRTAELFDNPSVRKILRDDEHQYLTSRIGCDCGTVLAPGEITSHAFEQSLAKKTDQLKRKGWSAAKIDRFLEDQRKTNTRPRRNGPDSLESWHAALADLCENLKLPYVGLLVRWYKGSIETEEFDVSRRDVGKGPSWLDALRAINPDEVTFFRHW